MVRRRTSLRDKVEAAQAVKTRGRNALVVKQAPKALQRAKAVRDRKEKGDAFMRAAKGAAGRKGAGANAGKTGRKGAAKGSWFDEGRASGKGSSFDDDFGRKGAWGKGSGDKGGKTGKSKGRGKAPRASAPRPRAFGDSQSSGGWGVSKANRKGAGKKGGKGSVRKVILTKRPVQGKGKKGGGKKGKKGGGRKAKGKHWVLQ